MGSCLLLATIIGSGIMAERLSGGNVAIALLGNTLATGAMLVVLILSFGAISGAHFNPAVSLVFAARRELAPGRLALYIAAQTVGAIAGVLLAHAMFEVDLLQLSARDRSGPAQWLSELVASFGLIGTIICLNRASPRTVAFGVGLYIAAAYWFTASTSFANPAVTLARSLSDSFAGIQPGDVPAFVLAQLAGAFAALLFFGWLTSPSRLPTSNG
jgi:glycerol uptake facilitator-like aquaporin